jgi:hypothetical protein
MSISHAFTRRAALGLLGAGALLGPSPRLWAQSGPPAKVYKEATCGCCAIWARHLGAAGFNVTVVDVPDISPLKTKFGVPYGLESCHTAEIGGYIVEGHIPAVVIRRLLSEMPAAKGIAVPGMPSGSPGMESNSPETYEVILFGPNGRKLYARCRGTREI